MLRLAVAVRMLAVGRALGHAHRIRVRIAATASMPEWTASASTPRLPLANPTAALTTTSTTAATSETSAVRRAVDIRGVYSPRKVLFSGRGVQ